MSLDTSSHPEIDRRWFVRAGAAVVASVGLAGCYHDEGDDGDGGDDGGGGPYGDAEPPHDQPGGYSSTRPLR